MRIHLTSTAAFPQLSLPEEPRTPTPRPLTSAAPHGQQLLRGRRLPEPRHAPRRPEVGLSLPRPPRRSAPCRRGRPLPPRGSAGTDCWRPWAAGRFPLLPLTSAMHHVSSPLMMCPGKLCPSASYWLNRSNTHVVFSLFPCEHS